jgi:hypothetical protein
MVLEFGLLDTLFPNSAVQGDGLGAEPAAQIVWRDTGLGGIRLIKHIEGNTPNVALTSVDSVTIDAGNAETGDILIFIGIVSGAGVGATNPQLVIEITDGTGTATTGVAACEANGSGIWSIMQASAESDDKCDIYLSVLTAAPSTARIQRVAMATDWITGSFTVDFQLKDAAGTGTDDVYVKGNLFLVKAFVVAV